ncbi:EpsG family protein [Castellaniella sp.]|uniref:EpsG family protein n=1 Tax=Castellaniella sp. TaxID=1955812 RepID=UPI0035618085
MSFLALFVFSSLRFNAGYDYPVYYHFIQSGDVDRFEPLSRVLMGLGDATDPAVFFVLSSALVVLFYYLAFNRYCQAHRLSQIGIFSFLCLPMAFLDSLGVVRQFVAIAIFVYVASQIGRNLLWSLGLMLLAALFHASVIILIPLVLLRKHLARLLDVRLYILLWSLALVLGSSMIRQVSTWTGWYSYYFEYQLSDSGYKIYALMCCVFIYFLLNRKKIAVDANHGYLFNCFFLGILLYSAALPFGIHVSRISWALLAVHPLLFSVVLTGKSDGERSFFIAGCIGVLAILMLLAYRNPERDPLNQYEPFFVYDRAQRDLIMERSIPEDARL